MKYTSTQSGSALSYYTCDISNEEAVKRVFAELTPTLRFPIRGLVNCVGVCENWPVVEFPVDRFKRLFDINVSGTYIVAQAVAREVIKAKVSASMVLIGSISGSVSNRASDTSFCDGLFSQADIVFRELTIVDTMPQKQLYCSSLGPWPRNGERELACH